MRNKLAITGLLLIVFTPFLFSQKALGPPKSKHVLGGMVGPSSLGNGLTYRYSNDSTHFMAAFLYQSSHKSAPQRIGYRRLFAMYDSLVVYDDWREVNQMFDFRFGYGKHVSIGCNFNSYWNGEVIIGYQKLVESYDFHFEYHPDLDSSGALSQSWVSNYTGPDGSESGERESHAIRIGAGISGGIEFVFAKRIVLGLELGIHGIIPGKLGTNVKRDESDLMTTRLIPQTEFVLEQNTFFHFRWRI